MPEEVKKKRGRPRKNPVVETNSQSSPTSEKTNEFNSYSDKMLFESIFRCGLYDYFTKDEIDSVLRNPIANHETAIRLSEFVYGKNGIVSNSIDYMTALMTLDRIVTTKASTAKAKKMRELMSSTLEKINDKQFIRDALFTDMLDGIAFYYFETTQKNSDKTKYLHDYQVENIMEINELGINASILSLPWQYCKIVGKKNGRYVIAFDLRYFSDYTGEELDRKLKKYPKEIVDGYNNPSRTGDWLVLNSDRTMCCKIKCKNSEPWGRSLIIAALSDVLYKDYFIDTKRNVLDEVNNKIIYETFPEGKDKGSCALTGKQQQSQHDTVKGAIMNKNNRSGTSFFSVAAGTKLDKIDVNVDIFDSKNESSLNDQIAQDLGICASLIGAMSTGTFAGGQQNLEMITSQIYTWVCEWSKELAYVINKNIIKDSKNYVDIYYFPTSFVNRKEFFEMMKTLYTNASGSLKFLIASTGVDPDIYLSVMDEELKEGFDKKYLPHQTSFTYAGGKGDDKGGRPETDNPTENTVKSQSNNGNDIPSPSDK
jgi:hypothetical protein|nr:MAG TPA: Portal protein [Caudoviricetes sp.]